jgi:hypothetical protein
VLEKKRKKKIRRSIRGKYEYRGKKKKKCK